MPYFLIATPDDYTERPNCAYCGQTKDLSSVFATEGNQIKHCPTHASTAERDTAAWLHLRKEARVSDVYAKRPDLLTPILELGEITIDGTPNFRFTLTGLAENAEPSHGHNIQYNSRGWVLPFWKCEKSDYIEMWTYHPYLITDLAHYGIDSTALIAELDAGIYTTQYAMFAADAATPNYFPSLGNR